MPGRRLPIALAALILLAPARAQGQRAEKTAAGGDPLTQEIHKALDRARPALREQLGTARGGRLALVCLAALHDELPHDDPVLRKAVRRLAGANLSGTYDIALRLMVAAEMPTFPSREKVAKRDTRRLLARLGDRGFSYGDDNSRPDLSNTQYGALGLRAAVSLQCKVPGKAWRRLAAATSRAQTRSGGFVYGMGGATKGAYASMTVAGIAVLEMCRQHLPKGETSQKLARNIDRAWEWMERHKTAVGNPKTPHTLYFHYGLERAAILSERRLVGDVDWYRVGARMLLMQQKRNGLWMRQRTHYGDGVDTAFAVLFLRRKFKRAVAGPVTLGGGLLTRGLPEQATEKQIRRAVELDVARGVRAVPDLLKAMRAAIPARRKAAALAIIEIAGDDFGYHPGRDNERNAAAIKAAERWWFVDGRKRLSGDK